MLERASKTFRRLYLANVFVIIVIAAVPVVGALLYAPEAPLSGLLLSAIAGVTPFLFPFLVLNIWGAVRHKPYRWWHLILAFLSTVWIVFGVYETLTMTLPFML